MTRSAMQVEECCAWCRRPVSRCRGASCDDAGTYSGILLRGEWKEVPQGETQPARAAAPSP